MNTYTYFWVREEGSGVISPFFDREEDAIAWSKEDKLGSLEEADEFAKKRKYKFEGDCI